MRSEAFYDAVIAAHNRFQARMRRHHLKPIGFLGGREGEPEIVDFQVNAPKRHQKSLVLKISFPVPSQTDPRRQVVESVYFTINPSHGRPPDGCLFRKEIEGRYFNGTVRHDGDDYWQIVWESGPTHDHRYPDGRQPDWLKKEIEEDVKKDG